ncbi:GNAT family N-acetyltransferase [Nocardioides sp. MAHUQ-72]|uniref:GNAT family N-acetyltransferase n=1 Tax=unclassified Nocardioides TaxID=2615069 RepID=UPI00361584A5
MPTTFDPAWGVLAEQAEAEFMYRFNHDASPEARRALGMDAVRIGGGVLTLMTHDPTGGYWNKAVGLGLTEPLTAGVVDEVLGLATERAAPSLAVQVAPHAQPEGWQQLLEQRGLTPGATFVKYFGPLPDLGPDRTDLRVDRLGPEDATEYGRVIRTGFGMPADPAMEAWFAEVPAYDGDWVTYGAWDGDELAAVANLFVHGEVATLSGAATLPAFRGRGAQSALMAARLREGTARGCHWVSTETWPESPGNPNPSQHNMRRLGLAELYLRQDLVFTPAR